MKKIKILLMALFVLLAMPFTVFAEDEASTNSEEDNKVKVYFFRGEGCPHCAEAEEFFDSIKDEYGQYFEIVDYETWNDANNASLLEKVGEARDEEINGVPYIVIGDKSWSGYSSEYDDDIKKTIKSVYDTSVDKRYDIMQLIDTGSTNKGNSEDSTKSNDAIILIAIIVVVGAVVSGVVMARKKTV